MLLRAILLATNLLLAGCTVNYGGTNLHEAYSLEFDAPDDQPAVSHSYAPPHNCPSDLPVTCT